jgi:hypothetical protein
VLLPQAPAVFLGAHKRQPGLSVKEVALGSVKAANSADVTVENYGTVPLADAHESSCPVPTASHARSTLTTSSIPQSHGDIQHTVRYTELAPDRFKDFWRS